MYCTHSCFFQFHSAHSSPWLRTPVLKMATTNTVSLATAVAPGVAVAAIISVAVAAVEGVAAAAEEAVVVVAVASSKTQTTNFLTIKPQ